MFPLGRRSALDNVLFGRNENISENCSVVHGSSKPGNRSFGRFSRPLLEVYLPTVYSINSKKRSLAAAEVFCYCKGLRLSYVCFVVLDQKYKRGLLYREFGSATHDASEIEYEGKIHDFFCLSSGSTPSSTNKAFYSGSIRWVSSGELKSKYLCETNQHISSEAVSSCNLREYPVNTLLVAMYGLEAAGVRGTASILSVPATISQACMAIQQIGKIDIEYLYYWYIYNGQWIGVKIAQGTKQQNLSTDTLGNLKIHAPSYTQQKEVSMFLSQIDNLVEQEDRMVNMLFSVKKALMQQLFI